MLPTHTIATPVAASGDKNMVDTRVGNIFSSEAIIWQQLYIWHAL
jgi:hypothetical protein